MPKESILLKILTVGLYTVPLTLIFYLHSVIYPFVTVKVYSFQILIELLFVAWIALILFYPQYRPRITWLSVTATALMALLTLTSIFGVNPQWSFWSMQERGIGMVGVLHFFVFYLILQSLHRVIRWRKYVLYLFIISVFISLFAVIQQFVPAIFYAPAGGRPGSFFGNPTFLAAFLLFTVFLGFWLARTSSTKRARWWIFAGSLFEVAILFNANTRGAILGLAAGVGLMLLLGKKRAWTLYGFGTLVVFAIVLFITRGAALWQAVPGLDRITQISLSDSTTAHRLIIWKSALQASAERPVTGWGFENFRTAFDPHYNPVLLRTGFSETFFDKPHNVPLEMLLSGGVVTLLMYLALFCVLVRVLWRYVPAEFRSFGLAAVAAYFVQNLFVFDTFGSYVMFFALLAYVDGFAPTLRAPTGGTYFGQNSILIKGITVVAVAGMMLYAVAVNGKIFYANYQQYLGLNYFIHSYPERGLEAFKKGLAINQPYRNELRMMFVQAVSQTTPRLDIPNEEQVIDYAIAEAEKALYEQPDNYAWQLAMADARTFFQATNIRFLKGADEEIAKAIVLSPNRQQSYYVTAKLAWLEQGIPEALKEMQKAVDLDPQSGDPHFYYGLLAYQMGNETLAIDELERARELGRVPVTLDELKMVAGYYGDAEKYDIAARYFVEAHRLDPGDIEITVKTGIVYMYGGKPELAKPFFESALKTNPEIRNSENWVNLKPLFEEAGVR